MSEGCPECGHRRGHEISCLGGMWKIVELV